MLALGHLEQRRGLVGAEQVTASGDRSKKLTHRGSR
jgi:hypothetical protein